MVSPFKDVTAQIPSFLWPLELSTYVILLILSVTLGGIHYFSPAFQMQKLRLREDIGFAQDHTVYIVVDLGLKPIQSDLEAH